MIIFTPPTPIPLGVVTLPTEAVPYLGLNGARRDAWIRLHQIASPQKCLQFPMVRWLGRARNAVPLCKARSIVDAVLKCCA